MGHGSLSGLWTTSFTSNKTFIFLLVGGGYTKMITNSLFGHSMWAYVRHICMPLKIWTKALNGIYREVAYPPKKKKKKIKKKNKKK